MNWLALSLVSLLLMGLGNFCYRMASVAGQGALSATLIGFAIQAVVGAGIYLATKPDVNTANTALFWPLLAGVSVGAGILFMVMALTKPDAQPGVVVAIMNVNFLVVSLLVWLCLGQGLTLKQMIGFGVIVAGLLLVI